MKTKILIGLPTFNRVALLKKIIAMFHAQKTRYEYKLLVVNDGDNQLTSSDPRVIVANLPQRRCTGDKRLYAVTYAETNGYDVFLDWDDDDEYHPDYVETITTALLKSGYAFGILHPSHWIVRTEEKKFIPGSFPFGAWHAMTAVNLRIKTDNPLHRPSGYEYPLTNPKLYGFDNRRCPIKYALKIDGFGHLYTFNREIRKIIDPGAVQQDIAAPMKEEE